jgi:hypothetical protein
MERAQLNAEELRLKQIVPGLGSRPSDASDENLTGHNYGGNYADSMLTSWVVCLQPVKRKERGRQRRKE